MKREKQLPGQPQTQYHPNGKEVHQVQTRVVCIHTRKQPLFFHSQFLKIDRIIIVNILNSMLVDNGALVTILWTMGSPKGQNTYNLRMCLICHI